jgi:hypothetical protein
MLCQNHASIENLFVLTVAMPGHKITRSHIRNVNHRCFEVEVWMKEGVEFLAMSRGCTLEECLGDLSDDQL